MINLFQISPGDASIGYLSRIFGNVSGVIAIKGVAQGGAINILSTMFKVFNGVVLTIAVLMLIYITVVGVIGTAHEGEFMGKKMNNIWIPIRAVLGFALLVPTGAGYCGLQILMMWVIVQGVGAADVLWNTALSYINIVGTYPQVQLPSVGVQSQINPLFQGLVCDASSKFNGVNPSDPKSKDPVGNYYCNVNGGCSNQPIQLDPNSTSLPLGNSPGSCGSLNYCDQKAACAGSNANSLTCISCKNQVAALTTIVPVLSGIAMEMVRADYSYRDFYTNSGSSDSNSNSWAWIYQYCAAQTPAIGRAQCCHTPEAQAALQKLLPPGAMSGLTKSCTSKLPPANQQSNNKEQPQNASNLAVSDIYWKYWPQLGPNLGQQTPFIQTAVNYYMDLAQSAMTTYIAAQGQNSNLGAMQQAADKGWILAGAFYYELANQTGNDYKASLPQFEFKQPIMSSEMITQFRNNYSAAVALVAASRAQSDQAGANGGAGGVGGNKMQPIHLFSKISALPGLSSLDDSLTDGLQTVNSNFSASTTGGGSNPLVWITALGQTLLSVASILFLTILIVFTIAGIVGNLDFFVLGTGVDNPIGPTASLLAMFIVPLVYGLLGLMISAGALLAVYVPLIPFVVFAFGAIAWMISSVETMVAGPLVALGIISPSGQHELLGKAEPALMLLFNVFLRPSLMIFGLIAAMLLATVVIDMINAGFAIIMNPSGSYSVAHDPFGLLIVLCVYVMLVIAALNKCFAVINLLPQQVMRWIGGQGEAVEAPLQEMKGASEAGAGVAKGATSGTQESAAATAKSAEAQEAKAGSMGVSGGGGGGAGGGGGSFRDKLKEAGKKRTGGK